MVQILLIALSLAMDALAVSVSVGLANPSGGWTQALRLGAWFGGFQFGMPLAGYLLGRALASRAESAAPWVAFALLAFLGGRMLWEGIRPARSHPRSVPLTSRHLCLLALATSVDALAVGVSAACMGLDLLLSAAVIGVTAFLLSALGALLGRELGRRFHSCAQLLGGAVLLAIGVRFLLAYLGQ